MDTADVSSLTTGRRLRALRRASLVTLVLLLAQYVLGMTVNLYVTVPKGGTSIGSAVSGGPAVLSAHIVLGLLVALSAVGLLVQALRAHHGAATATAVVGLVAILAAIGSGTGFLGSRAAAASMAMAVFTGIAVLAYAVALFVLSSARPARGN